MLKHLMNGSSLIALALRAPDDEAAAKQALRDKIAGNAKVEAKSEAEIEAEKNAKDPNDKSDNENDDAEQDDETDGEDEEGEEEGEEDGDKVEDKKETDEEKSEREKQEKIAAKAQRKQDRMQARIDEATAKLRASEAETARLKAQLEADPDKKLTAAEIETRAKALADEAEKTRVLEKLQSDFDADCEKLRKAAKTEDKQFDAKIADIAEQFGPIPSFMIGVLSDLDNGGEVLAYLANDDDEAERLWDLKGKPAKMSNELVLISQKLTEAKKKPKKQISKVNAIDPLKNNGRGSQSTTLTEADAKNMESYVQKRAAMREAQRKARGY